MRLDVEALKLQVSDQPPGGNGLSPPAIQGLQNRSGHDTYQERVGGRVEMGPRGGEGSSGSSHVEVGESRTDVLEVGRVRRNMRIYCSAIIIIYFSCNH